MFKDAINNGRTEEEVVKDETLTGEFYSDKEAKEFFINGEKIRTTFYDSLKK